MYLIFNVFYFYSGVGQKDSGVGRAHLAPPFATPLSVIVYVLRQNCRPAGWRWDTIIGIEVNAEELPNHCKFIIKKDGNYFLKTNHQYYGQIQLGLSILNIRICDLIIYSSKSKSFLVVSVPFDEEFAKKLMIPVSNNYLNKIIHFACVQ
jgi:hypothetical protein